MQLFDNSFHQWKLILLLFIYKTFDDHFKFHSNLEFRDDTVNFSLPFTKVCFLTGKVFSIKTNLSPLTY